MFFIDSGALSARRTDDVSGFGDVVALDLWKDAYKKLSDPDTTKVSAGGTATEIFQAGVLENGRLWTDKSVNATSAVITDVAGTDAATITAKPDEFLITLSALSEGFALGAFNEPIDAVFMIDLSGSMDYGFDADGPPAAGQPKRVDAMAEALNTAIKILMDANPENRVGAVAYGAYDRRRPRTYPILSLGRYTVPAGQKYFSVSATPSNLPGTGPPLVSCYRFLVNQNIAPAAQTYEMPVLGGTPTQQGIYKGAQILMENDVLTYTDPESDITVTRKPVMILLTDGEPTFGWTDYVFPFDPSGLNGDYYEFGDAITPNLGIDVLTVATASYWKEQVQEHYDSAPGVDNAELEFLTIGIFTDNKHTQAVLDPGNNAAGDIETFQGVGTGAYPVPAGTYDMETLLDDYVDLLDGGTIGIPILTPIPYPNYATVPMNENEYTYLTLTKTIGDPGDNHFDEYKYADGYYPAKNAGELEEIFKTLATSFIKDLNYVTEIDPDDPDFSGYLTFSDVVGQYLEVKSFEGIWLHNGTNYVKYNGSKFAEDICELPRGAFWSDFVTSFARQLSGSGPLEQVTFAEAEAVVDSCIAAGMLYYTSSTDFSNQLRWYADDLKNFKGPYFDSGGNAAPPPTGAKCLMDLYPVEGTVTNPVTDEETDLINASLVVLTALVDGNFTDDDLGNMSYFGRALKAGQQIVRWYIPASIIPMRTVVETAASTLENLVAEIKEASPIRAVYSVGLKDKFDMDNIDSAYRAAFRKPATGYPAKYYFYTNQYNADSNVAKAYCQISQLNPYYYYASPGGKVPLYVKVGNDYVMAKKGDSGPFYAKEESFDVSTASTGYIVKNFTQITDSSLIVNNGTDPPHIASGKPKPSRMTLSKPKTDNTTATRGYVIDQIGEIVTGSSAAKMQIRSLGNNGVFNIPVTSLAVRKVWSGLEPEPVQVQLYMSVDGGAPVPVGDPVTLNATTGWFYEWRELPVYDGVEPDGAGNVEFITYTVGEIFPNGPPSNCDTHYRDPVWDEDTQTWSLAVIANLNNGIEIPALIIEKTFSGLSQSNFPDPEKVIFTVVGVDAGGTVIFEASVPYSDFTNGQYVFPERDPGTYTVTETGADVPGFGLTVSPSSVTVELTDDSGTMVVGIASFTNIYRRNPPPPGPGIDTPPPGPYTGDDADTNLWVLLGAVSVIGFIAVFILNRDRAGKRVLSFAGAPSGRNTRRREDDKEVFKEQKVIFKAETVIWKP